MSIKITELEALQRPLDQRVVEALRKQPDEALNLWELWGKVNDTDPASASLVLALFPAAQREQALAPLREAIAKLLRAGGLASAEHAGDTYYYLKTPERA